MTRSSAISQKSMTRAFHRAAPEDEVVSFNRASA